MIVPYKKKTYFTPWGIIRYLVKIIVLGLLNLKKIINFLVQKLSNKMKLQQNM